MNFNTPLDMRYEVKCSKFYILANGCMDGEDLMFSCQIFVNKLVDKYFQHKMPTMYVVVMVLHK